MTRTNSIIKKALCLLLSFLLAFSFCSSDSLSVKSFAYADENIETVAEVNENETVLEETKNSQNLDNNKTEEKVNEKDVSDGNIVVAIISTIIVFVVTMFMLMFVKNIAEEKQKNKN